MSKRKGLSLDDKRDKMLEIFSSSRDVFVIKDIEKLAVKKGIISQSVKDVLQSLVDDDLVRCEKIGISNYYWSFPSEISVKVESELVKLQQCLVDVKKQKVEVQEAIKGAKTGKEDSASRTIKMQELQQLRAKIAACDDDLTKYKENDPEAFKMMCEAAGAGKCAANRWLDNLECLLSWCKKQFAGREEEITGFFKENGMVDLDYL